MENISCGQILRKWNQTKTIDNTTITTNAECTDNKHGLYSRSHSTAFITLTKWCWWIGCYSLLIGSFASFATSLVEKWQENPTIMVFGEKPTAIWDIAFPAITICPSTKIQNIQKYSWFLFCKQKPNNEFCLGFSMKDKEHELKAAALVCFNNSKLLPTCADGNQTLADFDSYNIIRKVALKRDDFLKFCLSVSVQSCDRIFQETMTDAGLCYTYNMLNHSEFWRENITADFQHQLHSNKLMYNWSVETGFFNPLAKMGETHPMRAVGATYDTLFVLMSLNKENIDVDCDERPHGFKILFHSPDEFPLLGHHKLYHIGMHQQLRAHIKPQITQTATHLRNVKPQSRKCYFTSERYLKYFYNYNQINCELECLTNITLLECGCVNFAAPRLSATPICGLGKHRCSMDIKKSFYNNNSALKNRKNICDCLPKCNSIVYNAEVFLEKLPIVNRDEPESEFVISFKQNTFETQKRISRFGAVKLIPSAAGIWQLFVGVSIFSIFNVFYLRIRYLWRN